MLTVGSLFSGLGGLELGLEWSGLGRTVWQVENNEDCLSCLAEHWPDVARFRDVRDVGSHNLSPVDLICGGFPCQGNSAAGKGLGLADPRSGLWYEFSRIIGELRPRWVVVENVASGARRWVDAVRGDLERQGYFSLPVPLSARDVGAPHLRERIFLVARRVPDAVGGGVRVEPERQQQRPAERGDSELAHLGEGYVGDAVRIECGRVGPRRKIADEGRQGSECGHPELADGLRERLEERRGLGGDQGEELTTASRSGRDVADSDGERRGGQPATRLHNYRPPWYNAAGRGPFPPGPVDAEGWAAWTLAGGPEPSVLRKPSRVSQRVDAWSRRPRIKALGNSVVPQCAEVIGWIIRELEGW